MQSIFGDSRVDTSRTDTSSEGREVAPQHDCDQESHHLAVQLGVSEAMIRETTRRIDDMHAVMEDYCWRASVAYGSSDEGIAMDDFHTLKERVSVMQHESTGDDMSMLEHTVRSDSAQRHVEIYSQVQTCVLT